MIKEDKVKLMTKLAIYEQTEGKKTLPVKKYYRTDYISIKMIETAITTTIGYLLLVIMGILLNIDYLSKNIVSMDLIALGKKIIIGYVLVLLLFLLIAYIVYSIKYKKIKKSIGEYGEDLKALYLMYKREINAKKKEEERAGGHRYDETTGF